MRQNPHVRICGGPGSATTLVYPTVASRRVSPWRRACSPWRLSRWPALRFTRWPRAPPACRGLEHSRRARREYHRQPRGVVHSGSPHGEGARCTIRSGRYPRPGPRVRHVTRPARAPEVGHRQPEEGRADVERQIAQDVRGEPLGFFGSERIVSQLYAQTEPRAIAHRRADPDLKRKSLTRRPGWLRARSY